MISKKINYVMQSKYSDGFLKVEYQKTNIFTIKDFKTLNINFQTGDPEDTILVLPYFERHRSIKNFSQMKLFVISKLNPGSKIPVDPQTDLVLTEYFDSYELCIEYAKNRFKSLSFVKLIEKENPKIDEGLISQKIQINNNKNQELENVYKNLGKINFLYEENSLTENKKIKNHTIQEEDNKSNDKYDVLKLLPSNFQIKIEEENSHEDNKKKENFSASNIKDSIYNKNKLFGNENTFDNNYSKYNINNQDIIFQEMNRVGKKNFIDLNSLSTIDENRKFDEIILTSQIKINTNKLNKINVKMNKVIDDDLDPVENSKNNTPSKVLNNLERNEIPFISSDKSSKLRKQTYSDSKQKEKNDLIIDENSITISSRGGDLRYNLRKNSKTKNNKGNFENSLKSSNDASNNNSLQNPEWITKNNNKKKNTKENEIYNLSQKSLNMQDDGEIIIENFLTINSEKNKNNKNIIRKNSPSNRHLISINHINQLDNNESIKNSYLENLKNSKLISNQNTIFNANGKRLRSTNNNLTNLSSINENLNNDETKNNLINFNKFIENNNSLVSALLLDHEFKTKKLKKNKSRELDLPLSALCPICYDSINNLANLDNCNHDFCKSCIMEWSKKTNLCPMCKKEFKKILYYEKGKTKEIKVKKRKLLIEDVMEESDFNELVEEPFRDQSCQICNRGNDEDNLLICDSCGTNVCHTYCDNLSSVPEDNWYCLICRNTIAEENSNKNNVNFENRQNTQDIPNRRRLNNRNNYNNINKNTAEFNINFNVRNTFNNDFTCNIIEGSRNNRFSNFQRNRNVNYNNNSARRFNKYSKSYFGNTEIMNKEDENFNEEPEKNGSEADDEYTPISENSLFSEKYENNPYICFKDNTKLIGKIDSKNKHLAIKTPEKENHKNSRNKRSSNTSMIISDFNIQKNKSIEDNIDLFDDLDKLDNFNYFEDERFEKLKHNYHKNIKKTEKKNFLEIKNPNGINQKETDLEIKTEFEGNEEKYNQDFHKKNIDKINSLNGFIPLNQQNIKNKNYNSKDKNFNNTGINSGERLLMFKSEPSEFIEKNNYLNNKNLKSGKEEIKNSKHVKELRTNKDKLIIDEMDKYIFEEEVNNDVINANRIMNKKMEKSLTKDKNNNEKLNKFNHLEKNLSFIKKEETLSFQFKEMSSNQEISEGNHYLDKEDINRNIKQNKSKYYTDSEEEEDFIEIYAKQKEKKFNK